MKRKILLLLTAAALLATLTGCGDRDTAAPETAKTAEATAQKTENDTKTPESLKTAEEEHPFLVQITENDPAIAYVLVRMPDPVGLLPLPTEGEYTKTIRQTMPDGTEGYNTLHLTPEGFWMEDADCPGQDCVGEGKVTLQNREERVLWNMVICLPHKLTAELLTREEAIQMLKR